MPGILFHTSGALSTGRKNSDTVLSVLSRINEGSPVEAAEDALAVEVITPEHFIPPSRQQEVLAALVAAFPNANIAVWTHSPLVLSSARPSQVADNPDQLDPRLMTATESYRLFFGAPACLNHLLFDQVFRYEALARDPMRSQQETEGMRGLAENLLAKNIRVKPPKGYGGS